MYYYYYYFAGWGGSGGENIINLSSAEIVQRVVKLKTNGRRILNRPACTRQAYFGQLVLVNGA